MKKISKKAMGFAKIKKGFSLLEVLMALFVLSVGLLGALTLMSNAMVISKDSRDLITASNLAQEGSELVRWLRDNNNSSGADSFANLETGAGVGCRVDFTAATTDPVGVLDCNGGAGHDSAANFSKYRLYYKTNDGILSYSHDDSLGDSTKSRFSRRIELEDVANITAGVNDSKLVYSFVFWGSDWSDSNVPDKDNCITQNKCVYIVGELTDWKNVGP